MATPFTALTVTVPDNAAPLGTVPEKDKVMLAVEFVTMLPLASSTVHHRLCAEDQPGCIRGTRLGGKNQLRT